MNPPRFNVVAVDQLGEGTPVPPEFALCSHLLVDIGHAALSRYVTDQIPEGEQPCFIIGGFAHETPAMMVVSALNTLETMASSMARAPTTKGH